MSVFSISFALPRREIADGRKATIQKALPRHLVAHDRFNLNFKNSPFFINFFFSYLFLNKSFNLICLLPYRVIVHVKEFLLASSLSKHLKNGSNYIDKKKKILSGIMAFWSSRKLIKWSTIKIIFYELLIIFSKCLISTLASIYVNQLGCTLKLKNLCKYQNEISHVFCLYWDVKSWLDFG